MKMQTLKEDIRTINRLFRALNIDEQNRTEKQKQMVEDLYAAILATLQKPTLNFRQFN